RAVGVVAEAAVAAPFDTGPDDARGGLRRLEAEVRADVRQREADAGIAEEARRTSILGELGIDPLRGDPDVHEPDVGALRVREPRGDLAHHDPGVGGRAAGDSRVEPRLAGEPLDVRRLRLA